LPGPGDDFAGKYTIERTLGEGGMGVVYLATHRRISQRVAIKVLQPELLQHAEVVARFDREARAAGQLRSKHAVRVLDVGELPTGEPFMVMEYLEGIDLGAELLRRGPLPIAEAVDLVLQACAAMLEAHGRGIVHRDLKPSNLFLADEDGARVVKVLDFGISKLDEGGSAVTATHATMGTPLYMSPEQLRSTKQVDLRADIWSLGVILYELLVGRPPFEGAPAAVGAAIVADPVPSVRVARPEVPEELAAVVAKALEKDREQRFGDMRALARALMPWASAPLPRELAAPSSAATPSAASGAKDAPLAPTVAATPPTAGAWTRAGAGAKPRRWAYAAAVAFVVALAGAIGAFVARGGSPSPDAAATTSASATRSIAPVEAAASVVTPPPPEAASAAPSSSVAAAPPDGSASSIPAEPAVSAKPTPKVPWTPTKKNPNRL
jgi:eukaryotic-like serine/threonine-protein kinase